MSIIINQLIVHFLTDHNRYPFRGSGCWSYRETITPVLFIRELCEFNESNGNDGCERKNQRFRSHL